MFLDWKNKNCTKIIFKKDFLEFLSKTLKKKKVKFFEKYFIITCKLRPYLGDLHFLKKISSILTWDDIIMRL